MSSIAHRTTRTLDGAATRKQASEPEVVEPSFDYHGTLHVLRDNLGKANAFITAAEHLIEQPGDGDDGDRIHVEHLVEAAKLAVRAAIHAGDELDRHRGA